MPIDKGAARRLSMRKNQSDTAIAGGGGADEPVQTEDPKVDALLIKIVTELIEAKNLQEDYDKEASDDRSGTFEEMAGIKSFLLRSILGSVSTEKAKEAFLGMAVAGRELKGLQKFFGSTFAGLLSTLNDHFADQIDVQNELAVQAKIDASTKKDDEDDRARLSTGDTEYEPTEKEKKGGGGFFSSLIMALGKFKPLAILAGMGALLLGGGFLAPLLGLPFLLLGLSAGYLITQVKAMMKDGLTGGEAVQKVIGNIWDGLLDTVLFVTGFITDKIRQIDFGILTIIADLIDVTVEGIVGVFDALGNSFGIAWRAVQRLGTAFANFDLAGVGSALLDILTGIPKLFFEIAGKLSKFIGGVFMSFFDTMLKDTKLGDFIQPGIDAITGLFTWLEGFFSGFDFKHLQTWLPERWEMLKEGLNAAFGGTFETIKTAFFGVVNSLGDWLTSVADKIMNGVITPVIEEFNEIMDTFTYAFDVIAQLFVGAKRVLGEALDPTAFLVDIASKAKEVFQFIGDVFTKLFSIDFWKATLRKVWASISGKMGTIFGEIGNFVFGSGTPKTSEMEIPPAARPTTSQLQKFIRPIIPSAPIHETKGGLAIQERAAIMSAATVELRNRTIDGEDRKKDESAAAQMNSLSVAPTVINNVASSNHHYSTRVSPHAEVFATAMNHLGAKYAT